MAAPVQIGFSVEVEGSAVCQVRQRNPPGSVHRVRSGECNRSLRARSGEVVEVESTADGGSVRVCGQDTCDLQESIYVLPAGSKYDAGARDGRSTKTSSGALTISSPARDAVENI